jgi:ketosteroid isomerase-like protein
MFAADHLRDAIARLYERYAELLPEGPERDRAAARARSASGRIFVDVDNLADALAPMIEMTDHRLVGVGTLRGPEAVVRWWRSLVDASEALRFHIDDVLALSDEQLLVRTTNTGIARDGGGAFERHICTLRRFDADGRFTHWEIFDGDREAEAIARFNALAGDSAEVSREHPFANAASRADRKLFDCFNGRDWAGIEALAAAELVFDERRRLVRNRCGRDVWLEQFRILFDVPASRFTTQLLATRGERLSLNLHCFTGEVAGGGGPLAMEDHLALHEVDRDGRIALIVLFDLEDRDAAYAELDARFERGEAASHPEVSAAQAARDSALRGDLNAYLALCAPSFVSIDHRPLGFPSGTAEQHFQRVRTIFDLAPDVRSHRYHVRMSSRGLLIVVTWRGTRDGGEFEIPYINVHEVDAHGKLRRFDSYAPEQLDAALARFEEIRAIERRDPLAALVEPNLATASWERSWTAFGLIDLGAANEALEAARAYFAPNFVWDDRRPIVGLSGGLDLMMASARERLASGARYERRTIVGTAGDRVAVARVLWAGGPPDGRFEVEFLAVNEVDEAGLVTAVIFFEPDDTRKAQREAWVRWSAIDPAVAAMVAPFGEILDASNEHDLARYRAALADDLVVEDHRRAGMGRIEGADAYLASVRALGKLSPDTQAELGWTWLAVGRHGALTVVRRSGSVFDGGGAYESDYLYLGLVASGRMTRIELFEMDAQGAALARFEALRPEAESIE